MRTKPLILLIAVLALTAGSALGAANTIPVKEGPNQLVLTDSKSDALSFRVDIGELSVMDIATKAGDFTRVTVPGFHSSHIEGAPELPMMNRLVAVPYGATAHVEILSVQSRTIDLADYGITNPIFPAQPSVSKSADLANLPFIHDPAAYDRDKVGGEMAHFEHLGMLRSQSFGRLEISPVEYLPRQNQLIVHESMDVRVVFEGADKAAGDDLLARTYSPFFAPMYARLAGVKDNHYDHPDRVGDNVTMVIVTPASFVAQLADFIAWKTERGFKVITAVIGDVEVGSTSTEIQTYLHGLYNNATVEDPAPSFVLFVGDVAECPTFTESGDATDRPYCAVDGDLYPEMYYGRFSATNPTELQAMIDKTMTYDQFTMADPSYLDTVVMIAGVDGTYAATHGNGQINYGTEHYFNAAHGITSSTYLYPDSDASGASASIIADCNAGAGFVNYTAHGSTTSWSDPGYTQSDINAMTNTEKYFLAIGNCCLTSSYDISECFAETWLRAEDKGAIGYIGGSNSTYWDEDYWFGVGYHASSEIDGTAYPYESTGLGAYDGAFHDHGEAPEQWYVTNDAIVFAGNMAVTEAGSSRETYYWNIYNLMGDPSLSTYMGVPGTNPVSHMPTFFTNAVSIDVDAAPSSYVGLTQDGVLMASGTVGTTGSATFDLTDVLMPGTAKLVVMMQNYEPYIVDVPVIVPATVDISPTAIDANVATDVTVTVYGEDGITPVVGLDVWAEGLGYATTPVQTDALGVAVINVNYPFGPTVDIVGKNAADPYELFREALTVNALALTTPDLDVTTTIGMTDMFPLNLPGTLNATVTEAGHTLYAVLPDGSELSTAGTSLEVTAAQTGQVTGIIAVSGYDLYTETFDVVEAYGTLTGNVDAAGVPAEGAVVQLFDATGTTEVASATCDAAGDYDFGADILVDDYLLVIDLFGYNHWELAYFLNYGANVQDIVLTSAPSGVLTGVVSDSETSDPLEATINVFRSDTAELYSTTTTDPGTGAFTTASLPYFEYTFQVRASHHTPVTAAIEIAAPSTTKDFVLDPTIGDVLVIDDTPTSKTVEAKYGDDGMLLAAAYERTGAKSVDVLVADLEYLGFGATVETIATTDPVTWWNYDVLLVSCGDNTTSLDDATFLADVVAFVDAGGHILLEGGEVGYNHDDDTDFAERVMHATDWNHDESGALDVADATHNVMSVPNVLSSGNTLDYVGYGDQDALTPLADAQFAASWSTYPTDAGVICYDPNPAPEGGQIVFFTFNYAALTTSCSQNLLQNAITWLVTTESGNSSLSGTVTLQGETDHSGVLVELVGTSLSTTTDAAGYYEFTGIFHGDYTVSVSKDQWHPQTAEVTVPEDGALTGVDFTLLPIMYGEFTGVVTDLDTTDPLEGFVRVSDASTGDVIVEVATDPVTGAYATGTVPYGDYNVSARANGHMPQTVTLTLDSASVVQDFALGTTSGMILVLDDHTAAKAVPDKVDEKGNVLAGGYLTGAKAIDTLVTELEGLGYGVAVDTLGSDPLAWTGYDLLIVSSGDNTTSLDNETFRDDLEAYVTGGGHLLLEGGEVGFDHYGETSFAANVMHVTGWTSDSSGDVTIADATHPVASVPNTIPSPITHNHVGYGDSDSMTPAADAVMVGAWTTGTQASIVCYDDTPSPLGGQIVFFTFNYEALDGTVRIDLLQNAVTWLLADEAPGTGSISGTVTLSGETDHSGILVELTPGGDSVTTGTDGTYSFTGLYATTYTVTASKDQWSTDSETVTLTEGEAVTDLDMTLTSVSEVTECSTPALAIPDNDPVGVTDTLTVAMTGTETVTSLEVFVDITHTYQGDLILTLTSPTGTTATLHNRTGSSTDDIYGWYPTELTPVDDLSVFAGEDLNGDWQLTISDNANADTGTLNEWCLHVVYGGGETAVGDMPTRFSLSDNFPNPFNPMTTIKFSLPADSRVKLNVYDLAGRLVTTLIDDNLVAAEHTVIWDGRTNTGQRVASGTYYYRLSADGFEQTKKMMLIK